MTQISPDLAANALERVFFPCAVAVKRGADPLWLQVLAPDGSKLIEHAIPLGEACDSERLSRSIDYFRETIIGPRGIELEPWTLRIANV